MKHFSSAEARDQHSAGSSRGGAASAALRRDKAAQGLAAAIAFRESRRCRAMVGNPFNPSAQHECGALGYEVCAHRPDGLVA